MKNNFFIKPENLPDTLPIFPLTGILLLPGGQISLHMFENKYINMVQDVLATKDRLMGVVLKDSKDKLHLNGCAGRITSFEETVDNRLLIVLTGCCRFGLLEEIPTLMGYKRHKVDWEDFDEDLYIKIDPIIDREKLISVIKQYAEKLMIDMDWRVLEQTPNFNLITFYSMNLPFNDAQKQELLECVYIEDRCECLIRLIEEKI